MINDTIKKEIVLNDIPAVIKQSFTLATVAGRDAIADQIDSDIEEYSFKLYTEEPRSHIGASEMGHSCDAFLWFKFRWMFNEKFSGRMLRLFIRGHREEDILIELLRGIGFNIKQVDEDGKQLRIISNNKHFGGSSDSTATLPTRYGIFEPMLLEFKTSKSKLYAPIKNMGVIKGKEKHWKQMCIYGRKHNLRYALYICVNKDDDDIAFEVLELDWDLADALEARADSIISSPLRPRRLSDDPSFWECKFCPANALCHHLRDSTGQEIATPNHNCRSCYFAQALADGSWRCNHYNEIIPKEFIPKGCDKWYSLQY